MLYGNRPYLVVMPYAFDALMNFIQEYSVSLLKDRVFSEKHSQSGEMAFDTIKRCS